MIYRYTNFESNTRSFLFFKKVSKTSDSGKYFSLYFEVKPFPKSQIYEIQKLNVLVEGNHDVLAELEGGKQERLARLESPLRLRLLLQLERFVGQQSRRTR